MLKLSIIIVNWNTKELLMQCVKSLVSSIKYQVSSIEIIVVDNGSTDGSVEMVKKYLILNTGYLIHLIENQSNLGFAKGNNIGIKQARGEYIMLLNSDTIVKEGAIGRLLTFLHDRGEISIISPKVLNADGSIQKDPCYLRFPSPIFVLFYYNPILRKIALKYFPKLLFSVTDFSKPTEADQLPGAAMMVRKKVFEEIGLFDENFQIYFEDADLCMRVKKAGYKLMIEPSSEIIHFGRQSIKSLVEKEGIEKFYFLNFQSLFLFCKKHYSRFKYLVIRGIILVQMLISGKFNLFNSLSHPVCNTFTPRA